MEYWAYATGPVDEDALWPYARRVLEGPPAVLLISVHDSHELVTAVHSLISRGVQVTAVRPCATPHPPPVPRQPDP